MNSHAETIRRVLLDAETSTEPLDALLAEIQQLRDAIHEVSASTDDDWARERLHAALAAVRVEER